jgi:hypothetical protein
MELSKLGYNIITLTAEIPEDHISYFKSSQWFKVDFKIFKSDIGLYKYFYSKKNNLIKKKKKKHNFKLMQLFKNLGKEILFYPDVFVYWSKRSIYLAKKLIKKYDISTIITSSDPGSTHILGYKLKRNFPYLKWIGIFGDPWSSDPFLNKIQRARRKYLEKKIIRIMDKYVFTTENCRDLYCNNFRIDRAATSIFSRGYDPKIYNEANIPTNLDKKTINFVYTGLIGKNRNVKPFIQAILELKHIFIRKVSFYFIGTNSIELENKKDEFPYIIKKIGMLSFEKAIAFTKYADILLLFDNNSDTQLPAKVFEYLGTSNPILTFTTNFDSPLSKFIREINRGPLIYNEKEDIKNALKEVVKLYKNKEIPIEWKISKEKYTINNIVLNFAKKNLNFGTDNFL